MAGRGQTGRVAVGFVWSTLAGFLPPLVASAAEQLPRIELSVSQLRFLEIVPALRRGEVDLVIARALHEDSEMIERTLVSEPSLLAIPEGHRFALQDGVTVPELHDEPIVALHRSLAPLAYDAVLAAARELGAQPRIVQHVRSASEALALVSAGIGVYRLAASAAAPQPGVVYRVLEEAPTRVILFRRPEPAAPPVAAVEELAGRLFSDAFYASNDELAAVEARAPAG